MDQVTLGSLSIIKAAFGLDWIRPADPPRWVTASKPDCVYLDREFFAHEFEWSFRGRRYRYAVPVTIKVVRIPIVLWWSYDVPRLDEPTMLDDLRGAILQTVARVDS